MRIKELPKSPLKIQIEEQSITIENQNNSIKQKDITILNLESKLKDKVLETNSLESKLKDKILETNSLESKLKDILNNKEAFNSDLTKLNKVISISKTNINNVKLNSHESESNIVTPKISNKIKDLCQKITDVCKKPNQDIITTNIDYNISSDNNTVNIDVIGASEDEYV